MENIIQTLNQNDFSTLTKTEKTNLIKRKFPNINNFLDMDIGLHSPEELYNLYSFSCIEQYAKKIIDNNQNHIEEVKNKVEEVIDSKLKSLNLNKDQKELFDDIYKKTLLASLNMAAEEFEKDTKKDRGILYSLVFCKTTHKVLSSILKFEKKIDKTFPGLVDKGLTLLEPAIIAIVTPFSPIAAAALGTTGVIRRITKLFKIKNLEKTVNNMTDDLLKIEQKEAEKKAKLYSEKQSQLAKLLHLPLKKINQLDLSDSQIDKIIHDIPKNKNLENLNKVITKYKKDYIPSSIVELHSKTKTIQDNLLNSLKDSDPSLAEFNIVKKEIEESFSLLKINLIPLIEGNKSITEQIIILNNAAKIETDLIDKIQNLDLPEERQEELTELIKNNNLSKQIAGDIHTVVNNIKLSPTGTMLAVANFEEKYLSNSKEKTNSNIKEFEQDITAYMTDNLGDLPLSEGNKIITPLKTTAQEIEANFSRLNNSKNSLIDNTMHVHQCKVALDDFIKNNIEKSDLSDNHKAKIIEIINQHNKKLCGNVSEVINKLHTNINDPIVRESLGHSHTNKILLERASKESSRGASR